MCDCFLGVAALKMKTLGKVCSGGGCEGRVGGAFLGRTLTNPGMPPDLGLED